MTLIYALVWLYLRWGPFGRGAEFDQDAGVDLDLRFHLPFWSWIAQAAAAGALGGLAVGSACPTRWSGPMDGVLAVVVGLVATAAGIVGVIGETLSWKGPPFANAVFLGILAPLLAIAGLIWCVGLVSR
jgi:hypothetical protein